MNDLDNRDRRFSMDSWLNIALAIWVIISPFVLGFSPNHTAMWNNIAVGAAALIVAVLSGNHYGGLQALIVPLGAWLFASPFILGFSRATFVCNNIAAAFFLIGAALLSEGVHLPEVSRDSRV